MFAPTDDAFAKLPAGTVDGLLKPEKKADLAGLLTYHVVAGNVDAAALAQQIEAGGGSATDHRAGATLTAKSDGMGITLTDRRQGGTTKGDHRRRAPEQRRGARDRQRPDAQSNRVPTAVVWRRGWAGSFGRPFLYAGALPAAPRA